jgi:GTP cyclohydrolase II
MELARLAGMLPAFLVDPEPCGRSAVGVSAADLADWKDTARLSIAARARLPVAAAEDAEIVAFRSPTTCANMSRW